MYTAKEITAIEKLIENVDLKFTSNNGIPVKRASITIEEWNEIKTLMSTHMAVIKTLKDLKSNNFAV